ncbi:hypothetical protein BDA96_03G036500 [Sorghum bicolor]|uniref:Dof zinc finger protein n=4 Tax=Sorghum bicolor TaxID=4558 RepID=A0A921ULY5_SORBI|nr:hypothetical protein BDA96_03G036500 [Sorghum bicolor]KXG31638.1 hypothetical protein SORBI_3003G033500 [Sorghum bicolor]
MVRSAAAMEAGQVPDGRALMAAVTTTGGGGREPEGLPCPRCESVNTKFCYYNNYNLSQPRYFCKTCRRYWTRGGALRNVPVGGNTRKATPATGRRKRSTPAPVNVTVPAPATASPPPPPALHGGSLLRPYGGGGGSGLLSFAAPALASPLAAADPDRRLLDFGGSFTSLIAPGVADVGVHFSAGFLMGGLAPAALPRAPGSVAALPPPPPQQQPTVSQALPEGMVWSMGWPDLSI